MTRVAVVGGGISGLAVARALRERGLDPIVLEAAERAGGKVRSTRTPEGLLLEDGPASFLDREPALTRLVKELGLESRLVAASPAAKRRCVAHAGALHAVPDGPRALVRSPLLPAAGKLRLLGELLVPRGPRREETVAAWARRRFGAAVAERLVAPFVSGIFAGDAERLGLRSAFPQLAALEREHRSVILGALRSGGPRGPLLTFREGLQELTDALARELGPRLRTGAPLHALERRGDRFALRTDGDTLEVDQVVLALPAHAAAPALAALAPEASRALAAIPYAPVALVDLAWRGLAHPPEAFGFLATGRLLGCLFTSAAFPGHGAGWTLVSVRFRDPSPGDADLVTAARDELRRYLGIDAAPDFARVLRHERAIPQYELGHRERVAAVARAEARSPGLFVTGSALRGPGLPDCVREAHATAARVTPAARP